MLIASRRSICLQAVNLALNFKGLLVLPSNVSCSRVFLVFLVFSFNSQVLALFSS
jgi:hypothetical protein